MNVKQGDIAGMFAMGEYFTSPALQPIERVEEAYKDLVSELARFDGVVAANLLGGLLTLPQFDANQIRIETLLKLAHRHGRGKSVPTRKRLQHWLNRLLGRGRVRTAEDPPEDVFVANVMCGLGNMRVFTGTWENCDSLLQDALTALNTMSTSNVARSLMHEAEALLLLSEEIARRCELQRWTPGRGKAAESLSLPSQTILTSRAAKLRFSRRDLELLGVDTDTLEAFITQSQSNAGVRGLNDLDRQPLIRTNGDLLVSIPASITLAIRMRIIERMASAGELDHYAFHVASRQFSKVVNEARPALGADFVPGLSIPRIPQSKYVSHQILLSFDSGKYAHVLYISDELSGLPKYGPDQPFDLIAANDGRFVEHMNRVAFSVAARSDYTGGLTLLIPGGLGRGVLAGFPVFPNSWYGSMYSSGDLLTLSGDRETSLLRIWKLKRAVANLEASGVELLNVNGDLNLIGHWQQNNYRLLPDECDTRSRNLIALPTNALLEVRVHRQRKHDVHLAFCEAEKAWLQVERLHVDPFFQAQRDDAVYVTSRSPRSDFLEGIVETPTRDWWLVTAAPPRNQAAQRDTVYRVWDALLTWMGKFADVAQEHWGDLPTSAIHFVVIFDDLPDFREARWQDLKNAPSSLRVEVSRSSNVAYFRVPPGFLWLFAAPENLAERAFVRAFFQATATLAGREISEAETDDLTAQVLPNTHSRSFHMTYAQEFRHHCTCFWKLRCRLVEQADVIEQTVGLAWELPTKFEPGQITTSSECSRLLNDAVDALWLRIRQMLRKLDRTLVVLRCVENIEAVDRDSEQWRISAGALLAQNEDTTEVFDVATARESERARSTQACRVLIEMAICESPTTHGDPICESDFDALQAMVTALIYYAHHSDAVHHGIAKPVLMICGTGELKLDVDYQQTVVSPYLSGHFQRGFRRAADSYASNFPESTAEPDETQVDDVPEKFVSAVQAEYRLSPTRIADLLRFLADDALERDELIVCTTKSQFIDRLVRGGFSPVEVEAIFNSFVLKPRTRWNSTPSGFRKQDWYPWRFSRKLSLFSRPLICCGELADDAFVYAPGFVTEAMRAIVSRLYSAAFPKEYYHSLEMRAWADSQTLHNGTTFETRVTEELAKLGWDARAGVKMTELGASKAYGNVDVLAWNGSTGVILVIECKHLRQARTIGEICEKLRNFRGQEQDDLHAHLRRFEWLQLNQTQLARITTIRSSEQRLIPLLVTNALVPMQFVTNLPLPSQLIVPIRDLATSLPAIIERSWLIRSLEEP